MYLKSIKLVGFKSFADRTRLEFRPGVTVIVGPNGSGKSNVVDAVAWVMGTQAPKSLRTQKMEDVIFAGTATRPGLGRAEVTLVMDNRSGALPLDLQEVAITRRLYRDGSSDYEINGVSCRLLDIQELLSDSGVGRHQHVVIGQGQIDTILNATADEHRAVIEEAAGILKHRVRKERALRRLERTDADVLRLRDLIGEISRQMKPLRRQRDAAERHALVAREVKDLKLYLGGEELRRLAERKREIGEEEAVLSEELAEDEARRLELSSVAAMLRKEATGVGDELDRSSSAAARLETNVEQLRRIGQVAGERLHSARARIEGATERLNDLEAERRQLTEDLGAARRVEDEATRQAADAEQMFRQLEDEERSLADSEDMSIEGAIAVARGDLRSIIAAAGRDDREAENLDRRIDTLEARREEQSRVAEDLNEEIRLIDSEVTTAQIRYDRAKLASIEKQQSWEQAEARLREASVQAAACSARLAAVEEAIAGIIDVEALSMVEAAAGSLGSITARLDIPGDLAAAVDAALGTWAGSIILADRVSLKAVVASLKGSGRGGLSLLQQVRSDSDLAKVAGYELLIDRLGPNADRQLARAILGDVVLSEGWQSAWQLVERHPELRAVTPDGDLVTRYGVRIGNPDGASQAMLEIAAAEAEAADIELARAKSLLTQHRRSFDEARSIEREALEALEALEMRLGGATDSLGRTRSSLSTVEEELSELRERRRSLELAQRARSEQRRRLEERLASLEGEEAERQRVWEELDRRRQEVAHQRETARSAWQDAVAALRVSGERRLMLASRLETVASSLEAEDHVPDPGRLEQLETISDRAREALEILRRHLESLRERQAELRSRASKTGSRLGEVQSQLDQLVNRTEQVRERLSRIAVESAELRVRTESVAEGLRRDLDASEPDALAAPRPDGDDLQGLLASREAELRRMGPINPLAAVEYGELEERHDFLLSQLDDLEGSREELRKVIKALDAEIEARFLSAFEEIAFAFERQFKVLFPGGRGVLRLTDPDEPLSSGVEIEAQPLGKKVSKMSLLSGGERSLAALAFLFAVFEARPSPFYILDEVEAALDDANLRRFLRLLDEFRDSAQLLVITHQQQTMEIADVLYGVTMEPGGSSRAVAKVLDQAILEAAT